MMNKGMILSATFDNNLNTITSIILWKSFAFTNQKTWDFVKTAHFCFS